MATPEHWTEATLGEVTQLRPGKYLKKSDYEAGGPFPVYGSNSVMGSHIESLYDGPLVVMAGIGAYAGAVRLSKDRCWVNNNAFAILPSDTVRAEYLYFWLDTELDLGLVRAGTGQPYIQKDHLNSVSFTMPPLNEQLRIVDLIESVDSYIDALRVQADAARTARTSLLHELLIDTSGDWTETTLDAVGTWRSGGTPKAGDPRFYGGDIPFVAIGDLTGGVIRTTEKTLTPVGLAEIGHLAPEGSIFVSMYGSIGKTGVAGANMATNQAIAWLEPDLTVIDPAFMASWLTNHAAVFDSQGRGATQRNINRKMIRETPIVLPPLRVQNEIAHTAASINNLIGRIEETLSRAATVRQGILAELLSGNHEIPESYDALLEAS